MDNISHVCYYVYFVLFCCIKLYFQIASIFEVYVIPPKEISCNLEHRVPWPCISVCLGFARTQLQLKKMDIIIIICLRAQLFCSSWRLLVFYMS
jgi:hypothetical protein